jgi:ABC-type multidrug transport system fused ATPase/permease subunit
MFRLTLGTYWLKVAACILLEQALRASSLVWSLQLMERAWLRQPVLALLGALLLSLFVPFAIELLRKRLSDAWQMRLYEDVIEEYARSGRHTLTDWFDDDRRDRDVPFMASEVHQILSNTVTWIQTLAGLFVLVAFHIGVMCVLFSVSFGAAYGVALVLGIAMSRWFEVRNRRSVLEEQNAQAAISMRLLGSWDNIVLGNLYNRQNWELKAKLELKDLGELRQRIRSTESIRGTLVFLVVTGPVVMQFVRQFGLGPGFALEGLDTAKMLITIPFAGYVLQRLPKLFTAVHAVPRIFEQLLKVDESLGNAVRPSEPREDGEDGPHVEWQSLAFLKQGVVERMRGIESLLALIGQFRPGRHMVLGPAGSGKTTLMLLLKAHYPSQCFYFPGQNTLVFDGKTEALFDPVEKLIACLQQIRQHSEGGIILLDDWDVYLDAWNAEQVSQIIDDISQVRCVIETRRVNASEI